MRQTSSNRRAGGPGIKCLRCRQPSSLSRNHLARTTTSVGTSNSRIETSQVLAPARGCRPAASRCTASPGLGEGDWDTGIAISADDPTLIKPRPGRCAAGAAAARRTPMGPRKNGPEERVSAEPNPLARAVRLAMARDDFRARGAARRKVGASALQERVTRASMLPDAFLKAPREDSIVGAGRESSRFGASNCGAIP